MQTPEPSFLRATGRLAELLAIAASGGALFHLAGLPAAWLAGSMVAVSVMVVAGRPLLLPEFLRKAVFILLGLQIGSAVTWETLGHMARWPASLAILAVTVFACIATGYAFYRRAYGWDGPSAFFGSVPGALSQVLLSAFETKADMARVTMSQNVRLFFLIVILPMLITSLGPKAPPPSTIVAANGPVELAIAIAAGTVAGLLMERLRVPAGLMLGPTLVSAILHLTGGISGAVPDWVLVPTYVVLGGLIGTRFAGISLRMLRNLSIAGLCGFLLALGVSTAGAMFASIASGIPLAAVLVAFAPGGLEAMTVMAFALNLDPAYVGAHQIGRYLGISLVMPLCVPFLLRLWQKQQVAQMSSKEEADGQAGEGR